MGWGEIACIHVIACGDKMRLLFWTQHQKIELVFTQMARYKHTDTELLKYPQKLPEILANCQNASGPAIGILAILILLLASFYSVPVALAKGHGLLFDAGSRSVALFQHRFKLVDQSAANWCLIFFADNDVSRVSD